MLDAATRRALLDDYDEIDRRLTAGDVEASELDALLTARMRLILRYQDGFPLRGSSRCPYTGEVLSLAIDTIDLDGLWWDWDAPVRGDEELPRTAVGLTGSMELRAPVATTRRRCRPGPPAPFVIPALLHDPEVRAVVSSVPVGPHLGTLIVYYAADGERRDPVVPDWGSAVTMRVDGDLVSVLRATPEEESSLERDGDLHPWVSAGKLEWIAPGDDELRLRGDVDGCPFLRGGPLELQEIVDGVVHAERPGDAPAV